MGTKRTGRPTKPSDELAPGRKSGTKRLAICLTVDTIARLDARAERHHRSRTGEVEYIVERVARGEEVEES